MAGSTFFILGVGCSPKAEDVTGETEAITSMSTGASTDDTRCDYVPAPFGGGCDAVFPKWFFNPDTQRCEAKFDPSCEDAMVLFENEDLCKDSCEVCSSFLNAAEGSPLSVYIRNNGENPIFLVVAELDPYLEGGTYYLERPYQIYDSTTGTRFNQGFSCDSTLNCEAQLNNNHNCGNCAPPEPRSFSPVKIEPGAIYTPKPWNGMVWIEEELPNMCVHPSCQELGNHTCQRRVSVVGDLSVRSYVGLSVECESGICDCISANEGWCQIEGIGTVVEPVELIVNISHPADGSAELVFH